MAGNTPVSDEEFGDARDAMVHDQLLRLKELGTPIGQGYLLARPLTPVQAQEMLLDPRVVPV